MKGGKLKAGTGPAEELQMGRRGGAALLRREEEGARRRSGSKYIAVGSAPSRDKMMQSEAEENTKEVETVESSGPLAAVLSSAESAKSFLQRRAASSRGC